MPKHTQLAIVQLSCCIGFHCLIDTKILMVTSEDFLLYDRQNGQTGGNSQTGQGNSLSCRYPEASFPELHYPGPLLQAASTHERTQICCQGFPPLLPCRWRASKRHCNKTDAGWYPDNLCSCHRRHSGHPRYSFFSSTNNRGMPFTKPTMSVLRRYKSPWIFSSLMARK